jgi:acylpyruvate hydrolase
VVNDITARDFQYRSVQWLQGKTFERSTPVGRGWWSTKSSRARSPARSTGTSCRRPTPPILVFSPADLVAYISQIITLVPGDSSHRHPGVSGTPANPRGT